MLRISHVNQIRSLISSQWTQRCLLCTNGHSFRKDYSQPRTVSTYCTRNSTTELGLPFCTAAASQQILILRMLDLPIKEQLLLQFIFSLILKTTSYIQWTKSSRTAIKQSHVIIFWWNIAPIHQSEVLKVQWLLRIFGKYCWIAV